MARQNLAKKSAKANRPAIADTPQLPRSKPESVGISAARLAVLSDALKREIDEGTIPGAVAMIGRRGKVAYFEALGHQNPQTKEDMRFDSVFRIWSMTKPIVSLAAMQLVEDGKLGLNDPVSEYFPSFAQTRVGVVRGQELDLVPAQREMTVQDLLRHTSGLISPLAEAGPISTLYLNAGICARTLTNKENAELLAKMPLAFHPGSEWRYSRATDLLGSVIEVVSGQSLGACLAERIFAPLRMTDTGFSISEDRGAARVAESFPRDPWTGDDNGIWSFDVTNPPALESGAAGLVSTAADYARFAQMMANGGTLDRERIIGKKTIELMVSDHLAPSVKVNSDLLPPGFGFGLGFAVRRTPGISYYPGSVGQYYWFGAAGTQYWQDPDEDLWALLMVQAPGQRNYLHDLMRNLVYASLEN